MCLSTGIIVVLFQYLVCDIFQLVKKANCGGTHSGNYIPKLLLAKPPKGTDDSRKSSCLTTGSMTILTPLALRNALSPHLPPGFPVFTSSLWNLS